MTDTHAKFSPSSSARWINCSASISLEENIESYEDSSFASEGRLAHDLAFKIATDSLTKEDEIFYTDEMIETARYYVNFTNLLSLNSTVKFYEKKVFFGSSLNISDYLAFGTADCIVLDKEDKHIHIVDFKYGLGQKISAFENSQLLLYAIGACRDFEKEMEISKISLHIVQSRAHHYDSYQLSYEELNKKWIPFFQEKVSSAIKDPVFAPSSEACQFCKAKPICPSLHDRASHLQNIVKQQKFKDIKSVSEDQLEKILDDADFTEKYIDSVKKYVTMQAAEKGEYARYILKKGKTVRKINEELIQNLKSEVKSCLYKKNLVTLKEFEKVLKAHNLDCSDYVLSSEQKPILTKKDHD